MTKETYNKARGLMKDLESLNDIEYEHTQRHCVGFYGVMVKEKFIMSNTLREDFKKFVREEIEKLNNELEQL